jgi:hypothetical protein
MGKRHQDHVILETADKVARMAVVPAVHVLETLINLKTDGLFKTRYLRLASAWKKGGEVIRPFLAEKDVKTL